VDAQGRTWLIDFNRLVQGPLLYDYVSLEIIIKFDLLRTLNEQTRHQLEKCLLDMNVLPERLDCNGLEPNDQKALEIIAHLRQRASKVAAQDIIPYQVGLLLKSVEWLTFYNSKIYHTDYQLISYLHSFLSVRMLCQKFVSQIYNKPYSPWLDEHDPNRIIWCEGQEINLTVTEYKFFLVLYDQALYNPDNPYCTYDVIGKGVYESYEIHEKPTIQGWIARLRNKIQSGANSTHQYIETIDGVGYFLKLNYHQSTG
jgi:DNA-binding response OmpR family regulator